MQREKRVKTECVTMGHHGCEKILVLRGSRWVATQIVHVVYGRRIIENLF